MTRYPILILLMFLTTVPAVGKAKKIDTYPVFCSVLWSAVRDTLGNPGNYAITAIDDSEMTASFTVVGATPGRVNSVVLSIKNAGCDLQVKTGDSRSANDDTEAFKKRVDQSLAGLKSDLPAAATPKPSGTN